MEGVETLQPGQQNQRVVKLEDGSVLNRYWDDRDTPRPESWVEDIATAKSNPNRPATEIYRDLRSAAASGWDFSSRWMDNPQQLNTIRTTTIVPVDLNALLYQLEKTSPAPALRRAIGPKPRNMTRWPTHGKKPLKCICGITKRVGMPTTICRTIKSVTNSPLPRCSRSM